MRLFITDKEKKHNFILGLCFLFFVFFPILSFAASLEVSPIALSFLPKENAKAVYLTNSGETAIKAQIRVMKWTQDNGSERLSKTEELIASPPLVDLPPGKTQLIRIIKLNQDMATEEVAYRLIVDELPQATVKKSSGSDVNFLLRYLIPVFVSVNDKKVDENIVQQLKVWTAISDKQNRLYVQNLSDRYIKLSNVSLFSKNGSQTVIKKGLLGYIHGGKTMSWPITLTNNVSLDFLRTNINNANKQQDIPVEN